MPPRGPRELVDAPRAVAQPELIQLVPLMHELRVRLHEPLRGRGDDAVHVPAPRQHFVPLRQRVPAVRRAQSPRLHRVLDQRARVAGVRMLRPPRVGELDQDARGLLQLHDGVERVQDRDVRARARLRELPPPVEKQLDRLFAVLLRVVDPSAVERVVHAHDVDLRGFLNFGRRRRRGEEVSDRVPVVHSPRAVQLQLGVLHRAREVGDELPLVQLLRAVQPVRLPQAQLRLRHPGDLPRARALHPAEKDVLRLLPVPVLRQREPRAGDVRRAPLPPQTDKDVLFAEEAIQLRERVEAPRLLRVPNDVVLEKRDCDVPRVVRLSEVLDELARYLRLRLRQRYALEEGLDDVRPHRGLSLVVLLGEQRDHRLGERHLFLALERRPHDGKHENPEVVRHVRVSGRHLAQRRDEVAHSQRLDLRQERGVTVQQRGGLLQRRRAGVLRPRRALGRRRRLRVVPGGEQRRDLRAVRRERDLLLLREDGEDQIEALLQPERVRHRVPLLPGEDVLQTVEQRLSDGGVVELEKFRAELRVPRPQPEEVVPLHLDEDFLSQRHRVRAAGRAQRVERSEKFLLPLRRLRDFAPETREVRELAEKQHGFLRAERPGSVRIGRVRVRDGGFRVRIRRVRRPGGLSARVAASAGGFRFFRGAVVLRFRRRVVRVVRVAVAAEGRVLRVDQAPGGDARGVARGARGEGGRRVLTRRAVRADRRGRRRVRRVRRARARLLRVPDRGRDRRGCSTVGQGGAKRRGGRGGVVSEALLRRQVHCRRYGSTKSYFRISYVGSFDARFEGGRRWNTVVAYRLFGTR
mmetsp:Transcript_5293/g.19056  ORF Transcript_5293/g.19056 Transcript_5293/m.19056 type:complete len:807 (+) Transcript_5293:4168-6588(+)